MRVKRPKDRGGTANPPPRPPITIPDPVHTDPSDGATKDEQPPGDSSPRPDHLLNLRHTPAPAAKLGRPHGPAAAGKQQQHQQELSSARAACPNPVQSPRSADQAGKGQHRALPPQAAANLSTRGGRAGKPAPGQLQPPPAPARRAPAAPTFSQRFRSTGGNFLAALAGPRHGQAGASSDPAPAPAHGAAPAEEAPASTAQQAQAPCPAPPHASSAAAGAAPQHASAATAQEAPALSSGAPPCLPQQQAAQPVHPRRRARGGARRQSQHPTHDAPAAQQDDTAAAAAAAAAAAVAAAAATAAAAAAEAAAAWRAAASASTAPGPDVPPPAGDLGPSPLHPAPPAVQAAPSAPGLAAPAAVCLVTPEAPKPQAAADARGPPAEAAADVPRQAANAPQASTDTIVVSAAMLHAAAALAWGPVGRRSTASLAVQPRSAPELPSAGVSQHPGHLPAAALDPWACGLGPSDPPPGFGPRPGGAGDPPPGFEPRPALAGQAAAGTSVSDWNTWQLQLMEEGGLASLPNPQDPVQQAAAAGKLLAQQQQQQQQQDPGSLSGCSSWCSDSSGCSGSNEWNAPMAPGADMVQALVAGVAQGPVGDDYTGPRMQEAEGGVLVMTREFILEMTECFRGGGLVHARYAYEILAQAQARLRQLPTLVDVPVAPDRELLICGDLHGQYHDLLNVFARFGNPSPDTRFLFNGDLVDRGSYGIEVVLTLLAWQLWCPASVHINRGNHEARGVNCRYGFSCEVRAKYGKALLRQCQATFNLLPLAALVNGQVLVVHGGLPASDNVTLDDIRNMPRNREPVNDCRFGADLMTDLLWSDPMDEPGKQVNDCRGVGVLWGPDATDAFIKANNLRFIVRSHQVKPLGYESHHDSRVITVFSAPNYAGCAGNLGAVLRLAGTLEYRMEVFGATDVVQLPCQYYHSELDEDEEWQEMLQQGDYWSDPDAAPGDGEGGRAPAPRRAAGGGAGREDGGDADEAAGSGAGKDTDSADGISAVDV